MPIRSGLALAGFIFLISVLASANSIPITGNAFAGQPGFNCCFNGDFNIQGPGLSLTQGTPDGPASIGSCAVGSLCDFSYSIGSTATFCMYCTGFSGGSLGTKTADFLDPNLTFTGSAVYQGGSSMTVPMTISGTIIGYKLINCGPGGTGCSLGPIAFTIDLSGNGLTTVTLLQESGGPSLIAGVSTNFTGTAGTAATTPEPVSLVLTGTGLVGIWVRRKMAQSKHA